MFPSHDRGEDGDDADSTGPEDSEWFNWTTILHRLSKEMGVSVDKVTQQPYVKTLFWINYFKIVDEKEHQRILSNGRS